METVNENETPKKDTSFKKWFSMMWKFNYIQVFLGLLLASILAPTCLGMNYFGIDILLGVAMLIIIYKGFYRDWKNYINDKL